MSKSRGNGVDPLEMIERYGADALRFSLLQQAGKNQDTRFAEGRVRLAGTFCNKLWNAARFVIANLEAAEGEPDGLLREVMVAGNMDSCMAASVGIPPLTLPDRWMLSRLHRTADAVAQGLSAYDMDDAVRALYSLVWDDFCDWYVEIAKPRVRAGGGDAVLARMVLTHVLDMTIRLLHPVIPHITEELWQALADACGAWPSEDRTIMLAPYPTIEPAFVSDAAEQRMGVLMESVRSLRNLRAEFRVPPAARVPVVVVPAGRAEGLLFGDNEATVASLARISSLSIAQVAPSSDSLWATCSVPGADLYADIGAGIDIAKEQERVAADICAAEQEIAKCSAKLSNASFVSKAPQAVVKKERDALARHTDALASLQERRGRLAGTGKMGLQESSRLTPKTSFEGKHSDEAS